MDIKIAAKETSKLIDDCTLFNPGKPNASKEHMREMVAKIVSGEVSGEKAHRWLGWLQACIYVSSDVTLDELKLINYEA